MLFSDIVNGKDKASFARIQAVGGPCLFVREVINSQRFIGWSKQTT